MRFSWQTSTSWIGIWSVTIVGAVTVPAAIDIQPSQYWEGNDGPWSSFPVQVGSPAQDVRVFISTASTSTWVVGEFGCEGGGVPSNCSSIRGGLFNFTSSSSWVKNGDFGLYIEDNLGYGDEGEFGFDTVALGFPGSGGPSLNHTVVAWIETFDFFLGELGLNPRPTNFSTFNDPQTSYLSLLYEQSAIPSLSYGYTAGAQYRFNGVLGSLTLGGYDEGLFAPNDVSFPFYFDQTRDLTVGLQSISVSNTTTQSLLPNGILIFIDSTTSQIWLPMEACQAFEAAFGLVYDNTTNLYLVNNTQHATLLAQNSTVTFTLAPTLSSTASQQVNITFPYAAFDLLVEYPLVSATTRYFPLRRAANDTQYTLGRSFLQEAYITVDYQRNNFSISQRVWNLTPTKHIVDIFPPTAVNSSSGSSSTSSGSTSGSGNGTSPPKASNKLPSGAVGGIVVGVIALIAGAAGGVWFYLRRRKRLADEKASAKLAAQIESEPKPEISPDKKPDSDEYIAGVHHELGEHKYTPPELHGMHTFTGAEVDGTPGSERRYELASPDGIDGRFELEAPHGIVELNAGQPTEDNPSPGITPAVVGSENGAPLPLAIPVLPFAPAPSDEGTWSSLEAGAPSPSRTPISLYDGSGYGEELIPPLPSSPPSRTRSAVTLSDVPQNNEGTGTSLESGPPSRTRTPISQYNIGHMSTLPASPPIRTKSPITASNSPRNNVAHMSTLAASPPIRTRTPVALIDGSGSGRGVASTPTVSPASGTRTPSTLARGMRSEWSAVSPETGPVSPTRGPPLSRFNVQQASETVSPKPKRPFSWQLPR